LGEYFSKEVRDREIAMLDRGEKWAGFRANLKAFVAKLVQRSNMLF
jgi:hypothetical protein